MYSIGQVARMTGITAFTLRYSEQIGLLPNPQRQNGSPRGVRSYDEQDLRFIRFIHGLKQTGMKLEDIAAFAKDGCLLSDHEPDFDIPGVLAKRTELLDRHLEELRKQMMQLEEIRKVAEEKQAYYLRMLVEHGDRSASRQAVGLAEQT